MTVTRGLTELKKLQRKIERRTMSAQWVGKDLATDPERELQSIVDIIQEKHSLKLAILKTNAVTLVTVQGAVMTVQEAIVLKDTFTNKAKLLGAMRYELTEARELLERQKSKAEDRLQKLLESLGKDLSPEIITQNTTAFWEANPFVIESGKLDLAKHVAEETERQEDFTAEIDFILSESNAVTELVDATR